MNKTSVVQNTRNPQGPGTIYIYIYIHAYVYVYEYRRLGGGAQRPNREIVSFRSCVRARGDCQVEMSLKRKTAGFPFSLFTTGGFPFSLGILPLLPSCYPALAGFIGNMLQKLFPLCEISISQRETPPKCEAI